MQDSAPGGYVYVIQAENTNHIKLGFSLYPEQRLKELQTGSPTTLRLLGYWPGTKKTERALHQRFERWRVSGEWFALPSICASLLDMLAGDMNEQVIRSSPLEPKLFDLKPLLPALRTGAWWEVDSQFRLKLRWRENSRKLAYTFRRLTRGEIRSLLRRSYEEQSDALTRWILGALFDKCRQDIARRLVLPIRGSHEHIELDALKSLAVRVLETADIVEARSLAWEQITLLNEFIAESSADITRTKSPLMIVK